MNVKEGIRALCKIRKCAEDAGMGHALFLGYGTLLGLVREKGFIGHDKDMDVCIRSDMVTLEQEKKFYEELDNSGLFNSRRRRRARPNGRLLWLSTRELPNKGVDLEDAGVKCCIWFQYFWKGYMWHSKGHRWIEKIGMRRNLPIDYDNAKAIAKGIPEIFCRKLITKEFYGEKFNVPSMYGSCLDAWYPDWLTPRGGSSKCEIIKIINDWNNDHTWKIVNIENY